MGVVRVVPALALVALVAAGCAEDDADALPDVEDAYAQYNSAPAILADGFGTMRDLEAVHLVAEIDDRGQRTRMELSVEESGDCTGRIQLPGWPEPADLVVVDDVDYLRAPAAVWATAEDGDALAARYGGRWVRGAGLTSYCSLDERLQPFERPIDEELSSKDGFGELDGVEIVKVSTPTTGGRLRALVTVEEPHVVPRLELTGGQATGRLEFSEFDEPVQAKAPPARDVVRFTD